MIDTAYWTICRSDCEVLQNKCGPIPQLDCSKFKNNTFECYRLVSNVVFSLDFYDIVSICYDIYFF